MKETTIYGRTGTPLSHTHQVSAGSFERIFRGLMCAAIYTAAAVAAVASPVLAEAPVDQTWNAEYGELLGQIKRLKESKKEWRDRLSVEALGPKQARFFRVRSGGVVGLFRAHFSRSGRVAG